MTVGYGLGMLLVGLIAITIGGTIIYIVINGVKINIYIKQNMDIIKSQ